MSEEVPTKTEIPESERPFALPEPPRAPQPPQPPHHHDSGYRSLFWPLLLIGAGVLFLLINMNVIAFSNLTALYRLWPILLIAAGIDVLFARRSPILGGLLGFAVVGTVVVLVVAGPALGLTAPEVQGFEFAGGAAEVKHEQISHAINGAESANIDLSFSSAHTNLHTLDSGSDRLMTAEIDYLGTLHFAESGSAARRLTLYEERVGVFPPTMDRMEWDITLSPRVPTALTLDVASGSLDADLTDLDLADLAFNGGSGSTDMSLPSGSYDVRMDVNSGSVQLDVADGAGGVFDITGGSGSLNVSLGVDSTLEIHIDGASGSQTFSVPTDAAVQVVVTDAGSGSINIPGRYDLVDDMGDSDEDTGIWQTPGFARADRQIVIYVEDGGSGSFNLH